MEKQEQVFSWEALTRIIVVCAVIFLLWKMLSILSIVLIAVVLAVSFYPFIKKVQKKTRMPLVAAIFLVLI